MISSAWFALTAASLFALTTALPHYDKFATKRAVVNSSYTLLHPGVNTNAPTATTLYDPYISTPSPVATSSGILFYAPSSLPTPASNLTPNKTVVSACQAKMNGILPTATPSGFVFSGKVRKYYVTSEQITWNYAPTGWDNWLVRLRVSSVTIFLVDMRD